MVALNQTRNPPTSVADSASQHWKTPPDNNSFPTNRIRSLLRARYYDPHSAEFISPDPLEYVDGMSLFRGYFVGVGVDAFGLLTFTCNCKCKGGSWSIGLAYNDGLYRGTCDSACAIVETERPDFDCCTASVSCKEPIVLPIHAYLWKNCRSDQVRVQRDIDTANFVLKKCCISLELKSVQCPVASPPDVVDAMQNRNNEIYRFAYEQNKEISVHYINFKGSADGAKAGPNIFIFDGNWPNNFTLAHEVGHYLGLDHYPEKQVRNLMAETSDLVNHSITEGQCDSLLAGAVRTLDRINSGIPVEETFNPPNKTYPDLRR